MKAKQLWSSWLGLALAAMIAVQAAFIFWCMTYIVPIYQRFHYDGWLEGDADTHGMMVSAHSVVSGIVQFIDRAAAYWWLWMPPCVLMLGLALRRICSQNKLMVGFSTLASAAFGLMMLTTALSMAV